MKKKPSRGTTSEGKVTERKEKEDLGRTGQQHKTRTYHPAKVQDENQRIKGEDRLAKSMACGGSDDDDEDDLTTETATATWSR
jgi:hypothetical protein